MKNLTILIKLAAAVAAVAGIAYLVVKNIDAITEWLKNLCPCKAVEAEEEAAEEASEEAEEAPAAEEAVEEPAEEAPVEIPEGEPVAEESDFEA